MTTPAAEEIAEVGRALAGIVRRDEPVGARTTYRVGGRAALFVEVADDDTLDRVSDAVADTGVPVLVVGRGSNMLVADAGFPGLVIALGDGLAEMEVRGTTLDAGGAASLPVVSRFSARHGLTGFEWAVGVPGSIGGAVRMNAGGHGSDMATSLVAVEVVDLRGGGRWRLRARDLDLGYRSSNVAPDQLVRRAEIQLAVGDRAQAEEEIAQIVRWRRENQPGGQNAGSVFTNPPGDSAGRLIEAAGAKGLRLGTAAVSDKHANFIQADPDGSAADVRALMREVQRRVLDASGVDLVPETRLVGFDPRPEAGGQP